MYQPIVVTWRFPQPVTFLFLAQRWTPPLIIIQVPTYYKIASADLKQKNNKAVIPIKYIGDIAGMGVQTGIDSTIITGVAFQNDGSFVLSAIDKYTNTRVHFYRGSSISNTTKVLPVNLGYDLPPGFVISDLTSFSHPVVKVIHQKKPANPKVVTKVPENDWEKSVTLTRLSY